jgi:SNF2 family DNA or RNA helicase
MFPSQVDEWLNQDELALKIKTLAFEIRSSDVLDLPEKIESDIVVPLEPATRKAYNTLSNELYLQLKDGTVTVANALVKLLRLQEINSGYLPLDRDDPTMDRQRVPLGTEKIDALSDMLEDLPKDEPVVVFCTFRHDLAQLRKLAEAHGRRYREISGDTKDGLTNIGTMSPDADLVGVQWQSGGVGIDLTRAAYCFIYSHTFNAANYDQAIARLHRPGQKRATRFYRLIAENTVDSDIYAAIRDRKEVVEAVLEAMKARS